jgi:hypothetical protein
MPQRSAQLMGLVRRWIAAGDTGGGSSDTDTEAGAERDRQRGPRMAQKLLSLLVVACAAIGASTASAATYVHGGTTSGNVLAAGTTIGGGIKAGTSAVLTTSIGTITCTGGSAGGTVGASGGTTVSGNLTSLTVNTCTDTIPFITVSDCTKSSSNPVITVDNKGNISIAAGNTIVCRYSGGTCTFTSPTTSAKYASSTATLSLSNIPVTSSTGGLCPSSGSFSGTFGPVTVTSGSYAGSNVVVNGTP